MKILMFTLLTILLFLFSLTEQSVTSMWYFGAAVGSYMLTAFEFSKKID